MVELNKDYKSEYGLITYALAIAALLVGQVLATIVVAATKSLGGNTKETITTALSLIFQATNLAVFIVIIKKTRAKPTYFINIRKPIWGCLFGAAFGVICLFCFYGVAFSAQKMLEGIGYKLSPDYVMGIPVQDMFLLLLTVIAAPVCEELIFRSALLSGLKKRKGDLTAALLCAAAFSLMHMSPEQTVYQFCLGFGAAMLALSFESVVPAIVMHAISNLFAALDIIGISGVSRAFDWYEKVFCSNNAIFALSAVGFAAAGAAIFILVPRFVVPRLRSLKLKKSDNENPYGDEPIVIKCGEEELGKRERRIYPIAIGICGFIWITVFISGLIA